MKIMYQTEWQNIEFASFSKISSTNIAGSEFYDAFYRALFEKYSNYEALDADWRRNKDEITDWLASTLPDGARVLSIGCGLGYMEQRLWLKHGDRLELHVQDYASHALGWLRQILPADRIHEGGGSAQTEVDRFDLIYLSAVDYALPDDDLIGLLTELRSNLRNGGRMMMISASFLEEAEGSKIVPYIKETLKWILENIGLRQRGQLWGWMRTRQEYLAVMRAAGMNQVTDGFIDTSHKRTYWIEGMSLHTTHSS
jgi:SAM-dependent methyltransferase